MFLLLNNYFSFRVMLKFEQMHVLTPTHAFIQRFSSVPLQCPRYGRAYVKTSVTIRWWKTTVLHIIKMLRKPFFIWTKVQMVRLGKHTKRTPLRLKKVTAIFKPQKAKQIYS